MGPIEAFEFEMEGQFAALKAQLARMETVFQIKMREVYRQQKRIDAMHETRPVVEG